MTELVTTKTKTIPAKVIESTAIKTSALNSLIKRIKTNHQKALLKADEFIKAVSVTAESVATLNSQLKANKKAFGYKTIREYINSKKEDLGFGYNQFTKYINLNEGRDKLDSFKKEGDAYALTYTDDDGNSHDVPASIDNLIICLNSTKEGKTTAPKNVDPQEAIRKVINSLDVSLLDEEDKPRAESVKNLYVSASNSILELEQKLNSLKAEKKSARATITELKEKVAKAKKESKAESA